MGRSWKSTMIGCISGALTIIAASHHASFVEALSDFQVQLGLLTGLVGLVGKDYNVSGPDMPKPQDPPKDK